MKIDKEEYRTTYIGGSRNFLLIKYADLKKEYPYMVYIDYEMGEGWKWSVKCRNINEVRHVLYDMYGNHIERCMKLSELINRKEGTSEGIVETMQKREIISDDMVSPYAYGLGVRTKERLEPPTEIINLEQTADESRQLDGSIYMRILLDWRTGELRTTRAQKEPLLFFREDSIYCGDINEPITVDELKAMVSMGIRTFSAGRIKKMNYVFKS